MIEPPPTVFSKQHKALPTGLKFEYALGAHVLAAQEAPQRGHIWWD
jgi:hypothetical protein